MNCFRKSKEGKESAEKGESESEAGPQQPRQKASKGRLYRKKSEGSSKSSSNGLNLNHSGASGEKLKMNAEDGHGHSKKANGTNPKSEQKKQTFCWKQSEEATDMQFYGTTLETVAYMPVSKNDPFYNMNHPRRGKAVIFNFDRWDNTTIPDLELKPRRGSEKDKNDLTECLEKLDFDVATYDNCGNLEMWDILKRLQQEDHSDADCLVVAIFTHGERNTVFVRDGTQIPVNLIWENFEAHACPSLAGKPKIFIVQACRGQKYDSGTTLAPGGRPMDRERPIVDETDSATFSYVIPNAADIIVAFSCPLGHYSWRHPESGSWFIQSICKVFGEHAYHMDLQTLFMTVAREVALNYESTTDEWATHKKKQVPSTCSTLIRSVLFSPKRVIQNGNTNTVTGAPSLELQLSSIRLTDENKSEVGELKLKVSCEPVPASAPDSDPLKVEIEIQDVVGQPLDLAVTHKLEASETEGSNTKL